MYVLTVTQWKAQFHMISTEGLFYVVELINTKLLDSINLNDQYVNGMTPFH